MAMRRYGAKKKKKTATAKPEPVVMPEPPVVVLDALKPAEKTPEPIPASRAVPWSVFDLPGAPKREETLGVYQTDTHYVFKLKTHRKISVPK